MVGEVDLSDLWGGESGSVPETRERTTKGRLWRCFQNQEALAKKVAGAKTPDEAAKYKFHLEALQRSIARIGSQCGFDARPPGPG